MGPWRGHQSWKSEVSQDVYQVVAVGPKDMRMFYHSFDAAQQRWTVGAAKSKDGFGWQRQGAVFSGGNDGAAFDAKGAAACHVVRDYTGKKCAPPSQVRTLQDRNLQESVDFIRINTRVGAATGHVVRD